VRRLFRRDQLLSHVLSRKTNHRQAKAQASIGRWVAVRRFIFVAILTIIGSTSALADVRIVSSLGGTVGSYLSFFSRVRQSGQRVIIDGPCLSACTLVLSTIPGGRVCVTSRAVLGFHAPIVVDQYGRRFHSREATRAVVAAYPPRVRAWIRRHGGLTNNVLLLRGSELATFYPRCRR
jgi:hypothetical protein